MQDDRQRINTGERNPPYEEQESAQAEERRELAGKEAIEELLRSKMASRRSSTFPFGALLVDIDGFDEINRKYGSKVGDEVLNRVGNVLQDTCRIEDTIARYGDDSFLIILPDTNAAGSIIVGEKLIENIRAIEWRGTPVGGAITVSIGATCMTQGTSLALPELMAIVEEQLQQAKEGGRDRMVMNTRQIARLIEIIGESWS
jgi:diguanylate cyclase (GGDEF)-like protein